MSNGTVNRGSLADFTSGVGFHRVFLSYFIKYNRLIDDEEMEN